MANMVKNVQANGPQTTFLKQEEPDYKAQLAEI